MFNSKSLNLNFENEINRVIIHGVLHLMGFKDKYNYEKKVMRLKEDYFLRLIKYECEV